MNTNTYFIMIYALCFIWASCMYFFFLGPLVRAYLLFKRNNINCKLNLLSGCISITDTKDIIYNFSISNRLFFYKISISSPLYSGPELHIIDKDKNNSEFFFFLQKNYFIHSEKKMKNSTIYKHKNKFQYIFSHYSPIFKNNALKEVCIEKNSSTVIINSKSPAQLASFFSEIKSMLKDIHFTLNQDINFKKSTIKKNVVTEKLFMSVAITLLFITTLTLLPKQKKIIGNISSHKIQLWEVYKDYANVFDLQKQANNIRTLATNIVNLSVYDGEKPEIVPWGFNIKPDKNYPLSYKLILLPKDTEIVSYTNLRPIIEKRYDNYLFLFYDVSEIKTETSIKIYMKYSGNMVPLNKNKLKDYFSQWYFLS